MKFIIRFTEPEDSFCWFEFLGFIRSILVKSGFFFYEPLPALLSSGKLKTHVIDLNC